jgi:hypothetical protein
MLPWWWGHYEQHNTLPVAFADFGMTQQAKKWCQNKGDVITLEAPRHFVFPPALIAPELISFWEQTKGSDFWEGRDLRFYQPFALKQSPFDETIWIDLDCEVTGDLRPLLSKVHAYSKIALAKCREQYQTHLMALHRTSPLLNSWAELCQWHNDRFLDGEEALATLIQEEEIEVAELASTIQGLHPDALIFHWPGLWGKEVIRRLI